jgi:glycosyltransferase involved in cell wall biosynthesis
MAAVLPACLVLVAAGPEMLRLWLGAEFAAGGGRVLQILAVGIFFSCAAFAPGALLDAIGRPDVNAKFQLAQALVFLPLSAAGLVWIGIEGAAAAWALRCAAGCRRAAVVRGAALSRRLGRRGGARLAAAGRRRGAGGAAGGLGRGGAGGGLGDRAPRLHGRRGARADAGGAARHARPAAPPLAAARGAAGRAGVTLAVNGRFLGQGMTGVQRFAAEVTGALAASGAALRLLAPPGAPAALGGVPVEIVGRRTGQAWEQLDLPRAAGGDLLLNLGNTAPLARGARQVVVIHDAGVFDTPESYSLPFRSWYRALHLALPRLGARVVTVSEFSRGRLAARLRLDPARIAVMPEGGEHVLRVPADAGVLARHGLAPGGYALAVGTRAAHKNLGALRDAAALLASRGLVLAVAGAVQGGVFSGPADAEGAAVRLLGRVTDAELRALYENALGLVFPSRYEGFGIPPLEAMWCGCPVLASRAGAVPEVCGDAALWFDADGPAGPAAALARLLDEPGLGDRLRAAGRSRAALYSWDAAARRLLEIVGPR